MKIGILTLPLETNYGGLLQAFALQKVLRDMGHDVMTIDRHNPKRYRSFLHHVLGFCKRIKQRYVEGKDVSVCWDVFMPDDVYKIISQNTQQFVDKNIRLTRHVWSDQLIKIDEEYQFDAYVVGSDQVWLPNYCPSSFLSFVKRPQVCKVTYAASAGRRSWVDVPELQGRCRELAREFQGISAREEQLAKRATEVLGVKVEHVLDPTMLLKAEDYIGAVEQKRMDSEQFLFAYILDNSPLKRDIQQEIGRKKGLHILQGNVNTYYVKKKGVKIEDCIFPSVDSWINGYKDADFIVTDSFHGTVFAILFNKDFVVIGNKRRGMGRFASLLRMFGLEDRMVFSVEEAVEKARQQIDYSMINERLEEMRKQSKAFLTQSLS